MAEIDYNKLIQRRHPGYNELKEESDFFESTYKGGKEWFDKNIFKYTKEGPVNFNSRVQRAYRFNHTKEIVDAITKYIFKNKIMRSEDAPESVQKFWRQSTMYGRDIDGLAKSIDRNTSIFGRVYIVVDSTNDGSISTVAEEKEKDIKTYAYVVKPQDVLDLSYDEVGELNWILIHEPVRKDTNPFEDDGTVYHSYRLWTREKWYLIKPEVVSQAVKNPAVINSSVEVQEGYHNLGVVPVIPVDCVQSDDLYSSTALISDIAYLDRAVANYLSNLDVIIQDQTFSQLTIPNQALPKGEDGYEKIIEMGTKSIFTYDGQGGVKPEYISPDPKQAQVILDTVNKIIHEIYSIVGMSGERTKQDNAVGIDNSSGVAKAYDFEKINTLLSCKARNLEEAENQIVKIVALWNGDKLDEDKKYVMYPQDFDVKDLYDEFEIASQLTLLDAPFEIRREQMKSVIAKLFPQVKDSVKEELIKALEQWPNEVEVTETLSRSESGNAHGVTTYSQNQDARNLQNANMRNQEQVAKTAEGSRQGEVTAKTE